MSGKLTFLTPATGNYVHFIRPFVYFAEISNPGCQFIFFVEDPDDPTLLRKSSIIYHKTSSNVHPKVNRWLPNIPIKEMTKYTYICDVDILHTEEVMPFHVERLKGKTFDNVERTDGMKRLTGLHFVRTKPWYKDTREARKLKNFTKEDLQLKSLRDEQILYRITKATYPDIEFEQGLENRPIHGIHCSIGRKNWMITYQQLSYFKLAMKNAPYFGEWFEENVVNRILNQDKYYIRPTDWKRTEDSNEVSNSSRQKVQADVGQTD